ncbi:hypothetical protein DES44_0512 [Roseateles depolymerans]|uniref:Uncharacterized protein n=1 Tax=Roseateles depolymerans TaxID=76731 RepID=A0A0U3N874_9BURK|nr:hypothetical protein RD2015_3928 [Roseateles depolymerans]REG21397.1 hypothetical protein DES44_0512 [Roseateles depolymerans]
MKIILLSVLGLLIGAAVFGVASYGLVDLFASWYGPRYIRSDQDIGQAYVWSLGFMLICLIAGAITGFRAARKWTGRT